MGLHILIVDDETLARQRLRTLLADCTAPAIGSVTEAAHATEAMERLQHGTVDVVLLDIHMPGMDGISFAQALAALPRPPAVVFVTAHAEHAVAAFELDAVDYLTKPVDLKQFRAVVASAIQGTEGVQPPRAVAGRPGAPGSASRVGGTALDRLVGESEAMRNVKQRVTKVARGMAPVLVRGESGTGKELVARALHENSQRALPALCRYQTRHAPARAPCHGPPWSRAA